MRQWITYDGAAVIIDWQHQFWFRLTRLESGTTQVVRDVQKSHFTEQLRRSRVAEGETRGLLHELSVRQLARCLTDYGEMLQLRVDPAKSLFYIELVPEADR